jgi:Leucine-rich repeat (LRR) protein
MIKDELNWNNWDDKNFLLWLKKIHPSKYTWNKILIICCSNNNLNSLNGLEKLTNLKTLYCSYNNLTSLNEVEKLTNLKIIYCQHNNFNKEYKKYLNKYCNKKNITIFL